MSHPDLFALLRGESSNAEALRAGGHLEGCAECRADLAELAVGNALVSRAVRTVVEPGERTPRLPTVAPLPPLPALAALSGRRTARRSRVVWLTAAAAAVVGVGLGAVGTALAGGGSDDPVPSTPVAAAYASVALSPVQGRATGRAQMVEETGRETRMTITAANLPGAGRGHFYYAWLLDPATDKMVPLGQVGPQGTASFDVDNTLLGSYSAIDVSLQDDDGNPGHSATSVLRGTYAGTALPTS